MMPSSQPTPLPGKSVSLRAALACAAERLSLAGQDTALLDAQVLLGHAVDMAREDLLTSPDRSLTDSELARLEANLRRRLAHEPIAYIVGRREFWSLDFEVGPEVLIPRPETERLVEIALMLAAKITRPMRILEIGTGSGAVAISLARELPRAEIWATDLSAAALKTAKLNALRHGVAERIRWLCGDLFAAVATAAKFSMIVSNPPYIATQEIAELAPDVSRWEPHEALDGGVDGLAFHRAIAAQASHCLEPGGALVLEVGAESASAVAKILAAAGHYSRAEVFLDCAGRDRVVAARRSERCGLEQDDRG